MDIGSSFKGLSGTQALVSMQAVLLVSALARADVLAVLAFGGQVTIAMVMAVDKGLISTILESMAPAEAFSKAGDAVVIVANSSVSHMGSQEACIFGCRYVERFRSILV